jgi:hypothetical protein
MIWSICIGIAVRQIESIIGATGYLLHASRDGKYMRGWCRDGSRFDEKTNEFEFGHDMLTFVTKVNVELYDGFSQYTHDDLDEE